MRLKITIETGEMNANDYHAIILKMDKLAQEMPEIRTVSVQSEYTVKGRTDERLSKRG